MEPTVYRPLAQSVSVSILTSVPLLSLSVRSAHPGPAHPTGALTAAIKAVDPDLAITYQTVNEQLNVFYIRERLLAVLSVFFGAFALLLAAIGLYGITSQEVTARSREIGIRMALGADRHAVVRMVLGRVTLQIAFGVVAGTMAAFWTARFIGGLLYDVPARDQLSFSASAALLMVVATIAGWLPARRAARIDPAISLREG
jgi:ABC-type antimicrobial peptide transport system permease subunit